jgi:hypothetical protein
MVRVQLKVEQIKGNLSDNPTKGGLRECTICNNILRQYYITYELEKCLLTKVINIKKFKSLLTDVVWKLI